MGMASLGSLLVGLEPCATCGWKAFRKWDKKTVRLREYQQLYRMKYGLYMAYIGDGLYRLREYPTYIWDYIGDGL